MPTSSREDFVNGLLGGVPMAADRVERRLAAILAADVVGYSRLMGVDEVGTLARLKSHREALIDRAISEYSGRIVKEMGDGLLVEYPSVVEAVQCAVEIQGAMATRNADVPQDRRIVFRVGINVGDVIVMGDDIHGDGVNVAARIEALTPPGGICISRPARDQVRDKLDLALEDLGEHQVKNIARPVRVFRVPVVGSEPTGGATASEAPLALPDKPSIAVLPFENMSGDPEQEYFADGIAEDIITDLSKASGLFVIARNSAFTYKGRAVNVQEVSRDLGVRYVLEGSVRKAGNRVRITAQMIDGASGGHLWAERYDRDLTDIFAVQDDVTQHIVAALSVKLTRDELKRVVKKGTDNLEAYDIFLKGREHTLRQTKEANAKAVVMLERVTELDPEFAAAVALLAFNHVEAYINRWSVDPDRSFELARELALRAVALDDSEPSAPFALGGVYIWAKQHDRAIAEAEKAIALDPNFAKGYALLGLNLCYAGRPEEAIEALNNAMRLDPHYPDIYLHFLALANFHLERYDDAIGALTRRLLRKPESDISRVLLASSYGHQGRADEARAEWEKVFEANPDYSFEHKRQIVPYKNPADFEHFADGLRKAGLVE